MTEETAPRDKVAAWMEAQGVTIESDFIPYSQSRNAKVGQWPSLNWRVRVMKARPDVNGPTGEPAGGVAQIVVETDYSAGSGHAPSRKADAAKIARAAKFYGRSESVTRSDMVEWEIENGRAVSSANMRGFSGREPIKPDPCDVLYSFASDASVLDAGGFEDWARELGYDTDSRAAEATYRACLEIALKLRAGLGDAALQALREATEGY